jgi:predicted HTH transcriptional regulator
MNYVVDSYENYKEENRLTTNNARKIEFVTTTRVLDEIIHGNMSCEPVTIEIEPDCINIMNFPGIDRSISEKTIAEGKSFVSRYYRNRRLGEFLKELDLSEGHSSGIPTIQEELEKNGSPRAEFFTDENRRAMRIRIPIHPAFLEEYELENDNLLQNETSFETKGF